MKHKLKMIKELVDNKTSGQKAKYDSFQWYKQMSAKEVKAHYNRMIKIHKEALNNTLNNKGKTTKE